MRAMEREDRDVAAWDERYRRYQEALAVRFLLPALSAWGVVVGGKRVLEVGCGDGGCAAAFARAGARVSAFDIDARLVDIAAALDRRENTSVRLCVGDVGDATAPFWDDGPFDVVLMRDVVEHIADLVGALANVRARLAPGGVVFVVFPPYYSPYGAHQQILPRRTFAGVPYNKLPYLHLLPDGLFARLTAGDAPSEREVARLRGIRLTLSGFERRARAAGLRVRRRRLYLSRPSFALRYGLPVVRAGFLGKVPGLRELVVTAGYFLLESAT
jgi:SAM-dependent methyltransferase